MYYLYASCFHSNWVSSGPACDTTTNVGVGVLKSLEDRKHHQIQQAILVDPLILILKCDSLLYKGDVVLNSFNGLLLSVP